MKLVFSSLLLLSALALPAALPAQTGAAADTPAKTRSGVAFTQPKDWAAASKGALTSLTAPEGDLAIVVVDVGAAPGAREAATKAWTLYKPAADRNVRLVTAGPPGEGWDERVSIAYETSPD